MTIRTLHFLLAYAVFSLVLNDVARLAFPDIFQTAVTQPAASEEEQQDDSNSASTLLEEEVKHKTTREYTEYPGFGLLDELDPAVVHLITDDDVRHLAFLPIFSPPPDLA